VNGINIIISSSVCNCGFFFIQAHVLYAEGVSLGHFLSPWQRSINNEPGLHGQPWWLPGDTSYQNAIELLEGRWETIKL